MHVCKHCNTVLISYLMATNKKRKKKDKTNKHRKKYLYLIKEKKFPKTSSEMQKQYEPFMPHRPHL